MAGSWRTVRVFISSTFRDMQAERDHLVRFVFPKLRQELLYRRIHLVDVDLRWGVTSDQDALEVCCQFIDECRPRFLCMLGGRYGWTPPRQDHSITAAEVKYGVLDRLGHHGYAYFYFRDPAATESMGEEFREPPGSPNEAKLRGLKEAIVQAGLRPYIYPAQWDAGERRLTGLKTFGDQVYRDLLASIDDEFGTEAPAPQDQFAEENAAMEAFIEERVERFVLGSRQSVWDELWQHAEGRGDNGYLCLTGEPGSGKSALLGKFHQDYKAAHPQDLVIPHFVGASPGSTDVWRTLRRLCHELVVGAALTAEIPENPEKLPVVFRDILGQASAKKRVVILLDAINQFDSSSQLVGWWWLPEQLPATARIILSTLSGPALENLQQRHQPPRLVELQALDEGDREAIIRGFLQRYRKSMTDDQRSALLAKADAGTPLYLLVALEELRTLGTFEEITARIGQLPEDTRALFKWILERLENDDGFRDASGRKIGTQLVSQFVSLLGASRHGLSQQELMELLAPGDPQGNVAALVRLLRPYLMKRGELLDFYHGQFREAVEDKYAKDPNTSRSFQATLARYFLRKGDPHGDGTWQGSSARGRTEFPFHFVRSRPEPRALDRLFARKVPTEVCRDLCTQAALEIEPVVLRRAFLASRQAAWRSASAGFAILSRVQASAGTIALAEVLRETPFLRGLLCRPRVTIAKHWTLLLTTLEIWLLQRPGQSIMDPLHTAWKDKLGSLPLLGLMLRWRYGRRLLAWGLAWPLAGLLERVPDIWPQNAQELNRSFGDPLPELEDAITMFFRRRVQAADEDVLARLASSRDVLTLTLLQEILIDAAEEQPEVVAGLAQRLFDRCMESPLGHIPMAAQLMLYVLDRLLQGIEHPSDGRRYYKQFEAMLSAYLTRDERYYSCRVEGRTYKATFVAALLGQYRRWMGTGLPALYHKILARAADMQTPRVDLLRQDLLQDIEIVGVSANDPSLALEALRPILDAGWWKDTDKGRAIVRRIVESIARRAPRALEKEMSSLPFTAKAISEAPPSDENPFQTLFFAVDREVLRQRALREAISDALRRGIAKRSLRAFIAAALLNLLALFDSERYGNA